jgi:transposase
MVDNITVVPLPPYSPELNPVERIWLLLRKRFLLLKDLPGSADHRAGVLRGLECPGR